MMKSTNTTQRGGVSQPLDQNNKKAAGIGAPHRRNRTQSSDQAYPSSSEENGEKRKESKESKGKPWDEKRIFTEEFHRKLLLLEFYLRAGMTIGTFVFALVVLTMELITQNPVFTSKVYKILLELFFPF